MVGTALDIDDASKEVRSPIAHALARPEPDYPMLAKALPAEAEQLNCG